MLLLWLIFHVTVTATSLKESHCPNISVIWATMLVWWLTLPLDGQKLCVKYLVDWLKCPLVIIIAWRWLWLILLLWWPNVLDCDDCDCSRGMDMRVWLTTPTISFIVCVHVSTTLFLEVWLHLTLHFRHITMTDGDPLLNNPTCYCYHHMAEHIKENRCTYLISKKICALVKLLRGTIGTLASMFVIVRDCIVIHWWSYEGEL